MARHKFLPSERFAIYFTHGEKCYLCSMPIDLKTMEVDHVIPESMIDKPDELRAVLESLGLPKDFNVDSFVNWLPACKACNGAKNDHIFKPSPLIQTVLEKAADKAPKAESLAAKVIGNQRIAKALNDFERADEQGKLSDEIREALTAFVLPHRPPDLVDKPIRFTPLCGGLEMTGHNPIVRVPQGPAGIGIVETIDKSSETTTSSSMLIAGNPNDYEVNPVTGVTTKKNSGLN